MAKIIDIKQAADLITDGSSIMIGGFMGIGNPHRLIEALAESDRGGFTVICNDCAKPGFGVAKLLAAGPLTMTAVSPHLTMQVPSVCSAYLPDSTISSRPPSSIL